MTDDYHISMLRVTGATGEQAVAACVTEAGAEVLGAGDAGAWLEGCNGITSVVIDCTGCVQLTDHRDVSALAAWLSAAAVWLRIQDLKEGKKHG